ncbi:hypothetical protein DFO55_1246 [Grimontella sp. AG753]|nr:hypothetical protein DFO55_1246 [Grimontella sp. AG753]
MKEISELQTNSSFDMSVVFPHLEAFPASPGNRAVMLRIEPLRVSPLRASIPRPESKASLQVA